MNPTKFWRQVDWFSALLVILLMAIGWINIYAAVFDSEKEFSLWHFLTKVNAGRQIVFIVLAGGVAWFIFLLDPRFFNRFSIGFYVFSIVSLIAVLIFGIEIGGAKAWFDFGLLRLQPAEFAKYATALALARLMSRQSVKVNRISDFAQIFGVIFLPIILILLENETGSALIFISFGLMLYREGLPNWLMISAISVVLVLVSTLILLDDLPILLTWVMSIASATTFVLLLGDFWNVIVSFATKKKYQKGNLVNFFIALFLFLSLAAMTYWWSNNNISSTQTTSIAFVFFSDFFRNFQYLLLVLFVFILLSGLLHKYKNEIFTKFFYTSALLLIFLCAIVGADYFIKEVLHDYQQTRLQVLVNPDLDPRGAGYQVTQSKIAIGSGGLTGKGFLEGTQTKLDFVPDQSTDFIFCTIGEEYGWVGSLIVISLFITLLIRMVNLAERQKTRFSRVYIYAVIGVVFFHFLVNIGMTIGLFPVIGIPLPFISYGGSSLWSFTLLIFTALKLDAHRKSDVVA